MPPRNTNQMNNNNTPKEYPYNYPSISKEFIKSLRELYPLTVPSTLWDIKDMYVYIGEQQVVEKLEQVYRDQNNLEYNEVI